MYLNNCIHRFLLPLLHFILYLWEFSLVFLDKSKHSSRLLVFLLPSQHWMIHLGPATTPQLFATILPDSDVAKKMTISQTEVSYSVTDGLHDPMRKNLCKEVHATWWIHLNVGWDNYWPRQEANGSSAAFLFREISSC